MDELLTHLLPARDPFTWVVIITSAFLGGLVRGLTGFGTALVMAPLLSMVTTARETLCLVTILNVLTLSQAATSSIRESSDHPVVAGMTLASIVGVPIGIWLVSSLPDRLFGPVIGATVIALSVAMLAGVRLFSTATPTRSASIGLLSGVLTGLGGIGGPPAILYVLGVESSPDRARATFLLYFALLYPIALCSILLAGIVRWSDLILGLLLAPLFLIGGSAGARLYLVYARTRFRTVVLGMLIAAGTLAVLPKSAPAALGANVPSTDLSPAGAMP